MTPVGHASVRSSAWPTAPTVVHASGIEQWAGLGAHETTAHSPRSSLLDVAGGWRGPAAFREYVAIYKTLASQTSLVWVLSMSLWIIIGLSAAILAASSRRR